MSCTVKKCGDVNPVSGSILEEALAAVPKAVLPEIETASASVVIDMDANDTCKLQVNSSSDSDFIIDGATHSTYFSGYLVA